MKRLLAMLACWATAAPLFAVDLPNRPMDFERLRSEFGQAYVTIEGGAMCYRIDSVLADTDARRSRGLMWVKSMPADAGMIFDYFRPRAISMWMKNTLIPLDIAFIDADGRIINIARDTVPLALTSIPASQPARYALELNAGAAARFGLDAGSQVWVQTP